MESTATTTILFVLHSFAYGGGVENHTRQLAAALGPRFDCWFLYPDGTSLKLVQKDNETGYSEQSLNSENPRLAHADQLQLALSQLRPDIIQIQHRLHWHPELLAELLDSGSSCVMGFHDYFELSDNFTLLGTPLELSPLEAARHEYGHAADLDSSAFEQRLSDRRKLFSRLSARVVPSRYAQTAFEEAFDLPFTVIEYGIEPFAVEPASRSELRFGFIGALIPQKGWDVVRAAFHELRRSFPNSTLLVFGAASDQIPENADGVRYGGSYRPSDLPSILRHIDVGVIPSLFRETYCLVLSEFQQARIPVIASNIGALSERVSNGRDGTVVTPGDVAELTEAMAWFCQNQSWRSWTIPQPALAETMAEHYRCLYASVLGSTTKSGRQA